jgi:hypothetical protein
LLLIVLSAGLFYFGGMTLSSAQPNMSSLNSGPKGAKLLFDTLQGTRALSVSRNYSPLSRWRPSATAVLFLEVKALDLNNADKDDLIELEHLTQPNNRLVLIIEDASPLYDLDSVVKNSKRMPIAKPRWGIRIINARDKDSKKEMRRLEYDSSWQPVNGLDDAAEKHFGAHGAVIVSLHSSDFSNEALAAHAGSLNRIPPLLGSYQSVAFEETHLGIEESGSIAGLARRYRLQGLMVGLLLLTALFIWNQSVSFPPPSHHRDSQEKHMVGADSRAVFAGLLARHLTSETLMEGCIKEWNRVMPRQLITSNLPSKTDPVAFYRQLQESLPKKRRQI